MFNLKLYTVKERQPKNNEVIVLFGRQYSFGMDTTELTYEKVEYCWVILDEDGDETGTQICYEGPDDKIEEPHKLIMMLSNGSCLDDLDVYATGDDVEAIYATMDPLIEAQEEKHQKEMIERYEKRKNTVQVS